MRDAGVGVVAVEMLRHDFTGLPLRGSMMLRDGGVRVEKTHEELLQEHDLAYLRLGLGNVWLVPLYATRLGRVLRVLEVSSIQRVAAVVVVRVVARTSTLHCI